MCSCCILILRHHRWQRTSKSCIIRTKKYEFFWKIYQYCDGIAHTVEHKWLIFYLATIWVPPTFWGCNNISKSVQTMYSTSEKFHMMRTNHLFCRDYSLKFNKKVLRKKFTIWRIQEESVVISTNKIYNRFQKWDQKKRSHLGWF